MTFERKAETVALMNLIVSRSFVLSAVLHSGSLIVSYSFDDFSANSSEKETSKKFKEGKGAKTFDDQFSKDFFQVYSTNHPRMSTKGIVIDLRAHFITIYSLIGCSFNDSSNGESFKDGI